MKSAKITVTFNEDAGLYAAEETDGVANFMAFGQTPEEAMERLDLAKSLTCDCELCQEAYEAAGKRINPYDLSN